LAGRLAERLADAFEYGWTNCSARGFDLGQRIRIITPAH
jgi:hypothetical protein